MNSAVIVIPCFNEALRLNVKAYTGFLLSHDSVILCFVNDGSTDNTLSVLEQILQSAPQRVTLLSNKQNVGKAESVRRGVLHAMNTFPQVPLVGFLDADLSTSLEEWWRLSREFTESPTTRVIIGSRVQLMGTEISRSLLRHYLGRIFATFTSLLTGLLIYDSQCGAKLFRRETARQLFSKPFRSRWIFDVEILLRFQKYYPDQKRLLLELPLRSWNEKPGSKLNFLDYFVMGWQLIGLSISYRFRKEFQLSLVENPET